MQKPEFLNLEALRLFEAHIIYFLAEGWQNGNQFLFEAARTAFSWSTKSDLQRQFAQAGELIDQVLIEFALMTNVAHSERQIYDQLLDRYRCLVYVISDYKKLEQWIREIERLPAEPVATQVTQDKPRQARSWFNSPWLALVLLMMLIRACAGSSGSQSTMAPGYSYRDSAAYPGRSESLDAAERLTRAATPQTGVPVTDFARPFYQQPETPPPGKPK